MSDGGEATAPPHSESLGVEDQLSDEWNLEKSCLQALTHHYMISIKTGAPSVPWVERCRTCGYIDASALQRWADNAVKLSLAKRAQYAAIAAESQPFAFVQGGDGADLSLEDVIVQAFSAIELLSAANQTVTGARRAAIFSGTMAEIQRMIRIAVTNEIAARSPFGLQSGVCETSSDLPSHSSQQSFSALRSTKP